MKAEDLAVLSGALKRRRIDAEKGIPHSTVLTINKGSPGEGGGGGGRGGGKRTLLLEIFSHSFLLSLCSMARTVAPATPRVTELWKLGRERERERERERNGGH
jgi:hypothetical protein